jgi:hypothetical protein
LYTAALIFSAPEIVFPFSGLKPGSGKSWPRTTSNLKSDIPQACKWKRKEEIRKTNAAY